jgi:hypothetical protein
MTKDDQRVRETVQAELRRRRGALDKSAEERDARPSRHGTSIGQAARPHGDARRDPRDPQSGRQWPLPLRSGTNGE